MVFKCQEDSFLKEFSSKVTKCETTKEPITEYGKTIKFEGYQITLADTILFPAGGGQPHDLGWLDDKEVLQVLRKGEEAVHFTKQPIKIGTVVTQKLNWERRFDHMQQHSGQHLLSAVLEKEHNLPTSSWWLGAEESHVELPASKVTVDIIQLAEDRCNELIRQALPVRVKNYKADDPCLDEFSSKVTKCETTKEPITEYGKTIKFEGYQITLADTILFPAGGGQPHDLGWLDDKEVLQVLRKGEEAVHFTKQPIKIGTVVTQKLNWERRFDHMQQHSGQHLLSAVLEKEHNLPTSSWWLGAEESHVELPASKVTVDVIQLAEDRCNELIRQALPVRVKNYKADDPCLDEAHTRGLPPDCAGPVRAVCIGDYDVNMCCGTHVTNLSQLQMIKLVGVEGGKKGKSLLRFLAGARVATATRRLLDRERAMTALLKNEPSRHAELVQKLQRNLKTSTKHLQSVLAELAQHEVERIKRSRPKFVVLHRREATPEYNRAVCRALQDEDMFVLAASEEPDRPGEGQLYMQGPNIPSTMLGETIIDILKAKGTYKDGRFQGKIGNMSRFNECRELVRIFFKGAVLAPEH